MSILSGPSTPRRERRQRFVAEQAARSCRGDPTLEKLLHNARFGDPYRALPCIVELRRRLKGLEDECAIELAKDGLAWWSLAPLLGISEQAAYKRYGRFARRPHKRPPVSNRWAEKRWGRLARRAPDL